MQHKIDLVCTSNKAEVIEKLHEKIVKMRKAGLEKGGEFSTANVVFKELRRQGYIDKLADCKTKTFDRKLSVEDEEFWSGLRNS